MINLLFKYFRWLIIFICINDSLILLFKSKEIILQFLRYLQLFNKFRMSLYKFLFQVSNLCILLTDSWGLTKSRDGGLINDRVGIIIGFGLAMGLPSHCVYNYWHQQLTFTFGSFISLNKVYIQLVWCIIWLLIKDCLCFVINRLNIVLVGIWFFHTLFTLIIWLVITVWTVWFIILLIKYPRFLINIF